MHDTFLNERIYETLLKLCHDNKLIKLTRVDLAVNTDSHISEDSLREHFRERKNNLLDELTEIVIDRQNVGKLNAVIKSIEGMSIDG